MRARMQRRGSEETARHEHEKKGSRLAARIRWLRDRSHAAADCLDYNEVYRDMAHICIMNERGIARHANAK